MGKPYVRLDKDNAAVLLVDQQTGLLSLVRGCRLFFALQTLISFRYRIVL